VIALASVGIGLGTLIDLGRCSSSR
jgi:hypothetical protein